MKNLQESLLDQTTSDSDIAVLNQRLKDWICKNWRTPENQISFDGADIIFAKPVNVKSAIPTHLFKHIGKAFFTQGLYFINALDYSDKNFFKHWAIDGDVEGLAKSLSNFVIDEIKSDYISVYLETADNAHYPKFKNVVFNIPNTTLTLKGESATDIDLTGIKGEIGQICIQMGFDLPPEESGKMILDQLALMFRKDTNSKFIPRKFTPESVYGLECKINNLVIETEEDDFWIVFTNKRGDNYVGYLGKWSVEVGRLLRNQL